MFIFLFLFIVPSACLASKAVMQRTNILYEPLAALQSYKKTMQRLSLHCSFLLFRVHSLRYLVKVFVHSFVPPMYGEAFL